MIKILNDFIDLKKSFVFLCGSAYKNDATDKRYIIKKHISENTVFYPVIIDNAFNPDGFTDDFLDVALLEEIVAKIAKSTIVLVESFSSSVELGLFASSGKNNQILIITPQSRDIENYKIGGFIEAAFNTNIQTNIEKVSYRPAVMRVAMNSNWVDEYYYFKQNKLPQNLIEKIDRVFLNNSPDFILEVIDEVSKTKEPIKFNQLRYQIHDRIIIIEISTFLLFFVMLDLMINQRNKRNEKKDYSYIIGELDEIIKNTVITRSLQLRSRNDSCLEYHIKTDINNDYSSVKKHIYHIINLFSNDENLDKFKSTFDSINILHEVSEINLYHTIFEKLNIEYMDVKPSRKNFEKMEIRKRSKIREVIKYADNEDGYKLRTYHDLICRQLLKYYKISDSSFAYKEKAGIQDYVKVHRYSKYFLQLDILKFFNSIDKNLLISKINLILNTNHYDSTLKLLDTVFIKNLDEYILPLGFTVSPLLSDIYMNDFDIEMSSFASKNHLKFTRYADDICFSSYKEFDTQSIIHSVTTYLNNQHLKLNENKTKITVVKYTGDHVRMLGVNLVKKGDDARLVMTVGNRYINDLANEMIGKSPLNYDKTEFIKKRIEGKIAFIKLINHQDIEKLLQKLKLYADETLALKLIEQYLSD